MISYEQFLKKWLNHQYICYSECSVAQREKYANRYIAEKLKELLNNDCVKNGDDKKES